jgi:hypothetical protein
LNPKKGNVRRKITGKEEIMSEKEEKILYVSTHGDEKMDKASVPFVLANAAMAMDTKATVILQTNAVVFAKKGFADDRPGQRRFSSHQETAGGFHRTWRHHPGLRSLHQGAGHLSGRSDRRGHGDGRRAAQHRGHGGRCGIRLLENGTMIEKKVESKPE